MANPTRMGPKGLALLKDFEGLELKAYRCPAGKLTVGYGSTGQHVKAGMVITAQEAEALLRKDLARFEKAVSDLVKVPLSQEQFDCLASFSYNVGIANFRNSTLLRKLNAGDYAAVPSELKRWNKAGKKVLKGLTRRREAEAFLWATQAAPAVIPTPPDIEPVPARPSLWARIAAFFTRPA